MALLGIDVGGTGVKAAAYLPSGELLGIAYREYTPVSSAGRSELDPREVWRCARLVLSEAAAAAQGRIDAIAASSMGEMFVRFDRKEHIIGKCITYHDRRGQALFSSFLDSYGSASVRDVLGVPPSYIQSFHRLRLLQQTEPENMERTCTISFMSDFILRMLGAEHCCDRSTAMTAGCLNWKTMQWHLPYLNDFGIDPELFPTPCKAGRVVGQISSTAAAELGIREGALLVLGPSDQIAAMLGVGAHEPGVLYNGIGTVDSLVSFTHERKLLNGLEEKGFFFGFHCWPDTYIINPGAHYAGGAVLTWFREHFGKKEKEQWGKLFYREYDALIPDTPTDLLVVCHFSGIAGDPECKGAILNLTMDTDNSEIYRAFMEGESYVAATRLEKFQSAGFPVEKVISVGGASKSRAFMQIRADIFGIPIAVSDCNEPGTLGNAMIGGVAAGFFDNLQEASAQMLKPQRVFEPSGRFTGYYRQMYEKYKASYAVLKLFS